MKTCNKCGIEKELDLFPKKGAVCKVCIAKYKKQYNKVKLAKINKQYQKDNKVKLAKINKQYDIKWYSRRREYDKQYRKDNIVKLAKRGKQYRKDNKVKIAKHTRQHQKDNAVKIAKYQKEYKQLNSDKVAECGAKRRASKLQATPIWYESEKEAIQALYTERNGWIKFGVDAHVDHIIPLIHPLVCGLHTLANLQVLSANKNLSKSNKFVV